MKLKRTHVIHLGIILLALGFFWIGVTLRKEPERHYAHSLRNFQEADAAPGYPIDEGGVFRTATFDPAVNLLSSRERYRLPVIDGFEKPALTGEVTAAARGLVLMTGTTLVLGHRLPDGSIRQSVYSGLERSFVSLGSLIPRGGKIGVCSETARFRVIESDGIDLSAPALKVSFGAPSFPDPLLLMQQKEDFGRSLESLQLDPASAEKLGEILSR